MDNSNRPDIRAYIGATGSGKGVSIREHLTRDKPSRLIVWDPLDEYAKFAKPVRTLAELAKAVRSEKFAVAFDPGANPKEFAAKFAMFCRIAFAAGRLKMLVEELADVTGPSFAPLEWRRCTTQGRHRGLRIVAASQRPAQIDKQFLGGCTYIRCFTLRYPADRAAMAGAMDVPLADIASLSTTEDAAGTVITYVEKDFRDGLTQRNTIKLQHKK
jgi:hypothetical protein